MLREVQRVSWKFLHRTLKLTVRSSLICFVKRSLLGRAIGRGNESAGMAILAFGTGSEEESVGMSRSSSLPRRTVLRAGLSNLDLFSRSR